MAARTVWWANGVGPSYPRCSWKTRKDSQGRNFWDTECNQTLNSGKRRSHEFTFPRPPTPPN